MSDKHIEYLLFPGFSLNNKQRGKDLQSEFTEAGIELNIQEWSHWDTGSESFDIKTETSKFLEKYQGKDVCIFAKSIGTRFATELVRKHSSEFSLKRLVLMGIPELHDNYLEMLDAVGEKVTIVQNTNDPYLSAQELSDFLEENNKNVDFMTIESDTHQYPYAELFVELAQSVT